MAAYRRSGLTADGYDLDKASHAVIVNISEWTNSQDSDSHQKRSGIMSTIIGNCTIGGNQSKDHLRSILDTGWDVNEILDIYDGFSDTHVHRPALHQAARLGWTEGVKMLLESGAKCTTSNTLDNPLALALLSYDCSLDLLELLLKHGADPNHHDDQLENIALLIAIKFRKYNQNSTVIIQILLEHGANPNVTYNVNVARVGEQPKWVQRTALHEAARVGKTEAVKMLLDAGATCTTPDASQNPLVLALQNEDCPPDLIELLLKQGMDPNDHDGQFENIPLLMAIGDGWYTKRDPFIVQLLLQHGANPHVTYRVNIGYLSQPEWVNRTAVHEATRTGKTDIMKMLLDAGAKYMTSDASQNPLALALQNPWCPPDLIDLLLKHGVDPNDHDDQIQNIPLLMAIKIGRGRKNDTPIIECLLNGGARCKTSGALPNPLELALEQKDCHPDLIKLLLEHSADPNFSLLYVISKCKENLHFSRIVQLLLEYGANPNVKHNVTEVTDGKLKRQDKTALAEAVSQGWTEGVKMLLEADAKCTTSDSSQSALEMVRKLDQQRQRDLTIFRAIENCMHNTSGKQIVELLLKHGTDPNIVHRVKIGKGRAAIREHRTALHEAAARGLTEVVRMLFEAGADCAIADTLKALRTPLMLALKGYHCSADLIELLLKHGADPNYHQKNPKWYVVPHCSNHPHLTELVQILLGGEKHRGYRNQHDDVFQTIPLFNVIANYMHHQNDTIILQLLLKHGANPNVAHKVNMGGRGRAEWVERTALQEAAKRRWTKGVKILLDAGAKCNNLGSFENPNLVLALKINPCPLEVIELLLNYGKDYNNLPGAWFLLQRLTQYTDHGRPMFPQQQLDMFFLHGGNINMEDAEQGTVLESAVREDAHSNSIRWLIRHGAHATLDVTWLKDYFIPLPFDVISFPEVPMILLQAGMRVSHSAQRQLSNMELAITTGLQEDRAWTIRETIQATWGQLKEAEGENRARPQVSKMEMAISAKMQEVAEEDGNISRTVQCKWNQLKVAEEWELQRVPPNLKKSTCPQYLSQQMVDLQAFSDESLQLYPECTDISFTVDDTQTYQKILGLIHKVLEFLRQPQSLQWYCRQCVRENLVSLQPSVVVSLPVPSRLKRYILCHEI